MTVWCLALVTTFVISAFARKISCRVTIEGRIKNIPIKIFVLMSVVPVY